LQFLTDNVGYPRGDSNEIKKKMLI